MTDSYIKWLQLSDLHIFESTEWNLMLNAYRKLAERLNPDFIVVTGDYKHKKYDENYSKAIAFLNEIVEIFGVKKKDVFLVPGNHDVDNYEFREETINTIVESIDSNPDAYMKYMDKSKNLGMAFTSYNKFVKDFYGDSVKDERIANPSEILCFTWNNKINIVMLNTALISDGSRSHKEIIDINTFSTVGTKIKKELPTIVIGHHDIDSIYNSQKEQMIRIFESLNVRAYLCGDTHKQDIKYLDKYDILDEKIPCIVCGKSAVQTEDDYSDVGVINYCCKNDGYVYVIPYKWGEKFVFKKSDDFIYDIDKDFRFFLFNGINQPTEYLDQAIAGTYAFKSYSNINEAHNDIANDIKNGDFFCFYGLRGNTFVGDSEVNNIVKEIKNNTDLKIKFLISYPFSDNVRHRLKPLSKDNLFFEKKWRDTYTRVEQLIDDYQDFDNAEIRFHDTTLIFRLLFTNKHLYIGYYEPGKDSKDSAIYRFESGTTTYNTYYAFFEYQWKKAKHSLPYNIPNKYSFLQKSGHFKVHPSLVINTTSECNMHCVYCPDGGENLHKISQSDYLSIEIIKKLIFAYKDCVISEKGDAILRITGGEPLMGNINQKKTANILKFAKDFKKIVLCTNGLFLKEAYNKYDSDWNSVKSKLLLKISLDTLDTDYFSEITQTKIEGTLHTIIDNIKFAKQLGFKIELNVVATHYNIKSANDVIRLFEFAQNLGLVGVKVLTVNDFGGNVTIEQNKEDLEYINRILGDVIQYMIERGYEDKEVYLNDNKGIQMRRFIAVSNNDEKCTLTIVDHHNDSSSITPIRTFSSFCKSCKFYYTSEDVKKGLVKPCATGIMSISLTADGILTPCRLCQEKGINIKALNNRNEVKKVVKDTFAAFSDCFHNEV